LERVADVGVSMSFDMMFIWSCE